MSSASHDGFELRLRNVSGVPVLRLAGAITNNALPAIRFSLDKLANAGHYNVVLNLERARVSRLATAGRAVGCGSEDTFALRLGERRGGSRLPPTGIGHGSCRQAFQVLRD